MSFDHPKNAKYYLEHVVSRLPSSYSRRATSRLLWLPIHLLLIAVAWAYITGDDHAWPLKLVCSLVIGHSFACLMFVGHELMHGSILP